MDSLKVLFIGNSFAMDTAEHSVDVALSFGINKVKIANLYVGGCSIDMHHEYAVYDLPAYKYYTNSGDGWSCEENYRISDAVISENWDYIVIQHGTSGKSRYTSPECYKNLTPLILYVKKIASKNTKIAFNLTWMGEPTRQHHEILSYGGDTQAMREKLVEVTKDQVLGNPYVDLLIPTGTAIENARTSNIGLLTRDCYHLSMDKGRYIAALTLVSAVTGMSVENVSWKPAGVDEYALSVAKEAVNNALKYPLEITACT